MRETVVLFWDWLFDGHPVRLRVAVDLNHAVDLQPASHTQYERVAPSADDLPVPEVPAFADQFLFLPYHVAGAVQKPQCGFPRSFPHDGLSLG